MQNKNNTLCQIGAFKFYSIVENPERKSISEFKMASYAAFSEPFSKIAYGAATLTTKINLEFGATCHLGSAPVLKLNRYTFMAPKFFSKNSSTH